MIHGDRKNAHNADNSLRRAPLHVAMGVVRLLVLSNPVNDPHPLLNPPQSNNHTLCPSQIQKQSDSVPPVIVCGGTPLPIPIPIARRQAAQFN